MPTRGGEDWEEDNGRRRRRSDPWYRQPDASPLSSGTFWALWDNHMEDFEALENRVSRNEERLVENRAKYLVRDLVGQLWGKVFVIAMAILTAYALSRWADVPRFWTK